MNEKLVVIRTYTYQTEGLIEKAKLESAGIDCFMKDENLVMIQPLYSNAIGCIKLMVREEDAELALQILNEKSEAEFLLSENITGEETERKSSTIPGGGCFGLFISIAAITGYFILWEMF